MPFKLPSILGSSSGEQPKQEASLDDILPDTNHRVALLQLVATCTTHMRDGLNTTLAEPTLSKSTSRTSNKDELKAEPELGSENQKEVASSSQQTRTNTQERQDAESSSPRTRELKRAGIAYLNGWQTAVLKRMSEALSVELDAIQETKAGVLPQVTSTDSLHGNLPFPKLTLPEALQELDEKKRALVLGAILFLLLSLEQYPAQSRILMSYLCQCFELPYDVLSSVEATTATTLLEAASKAEKSDTGMDGEAARQKQADKSASSRKWKIGFATVAGAAIIGVTGGLAAPLLLGVAGSIMGGVGLGGLATLLGATIINPVTIGALFGALGARMTSSAMTAYSKEVQDFKFVPIHDKDDEADKKHFLPTNKAATPSHKLRVAIGISGWVVDNSDISRPWLAFSSTTVEPFALQYEKAAMMDLGGTMQQFLKDSAFSFVRGKAIGLVLPVLAEALAPLGLLKAGALIDNPFTIAMERSDKAGKVLAHALIDKVQGERPVTLVGFSLGARVIYSCLEELAAQNAFGLIENAILMGSPVPSSETSWRRMRAIVAGRLINVYTQKDMLLGYLYRARNLQLGVAGLQAITSVPGIENQDVSSTVTGHNQYRFGVGPILKDLNFADLDLEQVQREQDDLESEKKFEEKVYDEAKREGRLNDVEDEQGQIKMGEMGKDETETGDTEKNHEAVTRELEDMRIGGDDDQPGPPLPPRSK